MKKKRTNQNPEEGLRNELFDYRVDIKSYKKNLNTIIVCGTIVFSILGFMGYNKIENIEKTILEKANKRLIQTDSLLAKIDQTKIDSLNTMLRNKEIEYNILLARFEKIITLSEELQLKFLDSLTENERIESKVNSYIQQSASNIFEIIPFKKQVSKNQRQYIYLILNESVDIKPDSYLDIRIFPKDRRMIVRNNTYKVSSKFNKVSFEIEPFENYKEYELEISFFSKSKSGTYNKYQIKEAITLK